MVLSKPKMSMLARGLVGDGRREVRVESLTRIEDIGDATSGHCLLPEMGCKRGIIAKLG